MGPAPEMEPMSKVSDSVLDAAELDAAQIVAAQLVSRVKSLRVETIDLPIVDESGTWAVTVKRLGIRTDE
jgi:hypothetical protein